MSGLSSADIALLRGLDLAHLATINADGSPHVAPLWADTDGTDVLLNTAEGRRKVRNVRRDPRVGVSIARGNASPALVIEGRVVALETEGALEHIDALARRYSGEAWTPVPGQTRVKLRIRPERILSHPE